MMKKLFIVGLIVCSFFVVSISSVLAAENPIIIADPKGDVVDDSGNNVSSSPTINIKNIDIREITYSRQGKRITLTLTVYGNIQDTGNIDDVLSDNGTNDVAYVLFLSTSNEIYDIYYVNKECRIEYENISETDNISDFSVKGSNLTVSFDLLSNDETYESIGAFIQYYEMSGDNYEYLTDDTSSFVNFEVTINAPSEGKIGETINFSGEAANGTLPYAWAWEFGDGTTSDKQNPTHIYENARTYEVNLSVVDADSNPGNDTMTLTISDGGTSSGDHDGGNQESKSSNSGLLLFVAIIAIIVIAGVAIVVYIIRR